MLKAGIACFFIWSKLDRNLWAGGWGLSRIWGELRQSMIPLYHEGVVELVHPDLWIVVDCRGRCQEQEHATGADGFFCAADQFFADALVLVFFANSQIGQVAAIMEVG